MGAILPKRFEPIRVLRKGGASSTFVATDQHLGRNEVVVRVIGKGNFTPQAARLVEVFSWYRGVHHPFLSEVLDAGLTEKRDLYYVRPYHQDCDLFSAAGRNSLKALISAIDFLQSVGRVHGAIKPANIFAAGGAIKIGDPWIDESPDSKDPKRLEEGIRFSAPEILEGGAPTLDSDLYSLGALLYRFFSGRDPFEASEPEFLRAKYIWASPRPLSSVSHASRKIAEIVTDLLGKDPGARRTAFESLKNELEVDAMPASRGPAIGVVGDVEAALKHLNSKRFGAVLVHAMAGGGKSRFIEELTCRLRFGKQAIAVCATSASEPSLSLARRLVSLADEHSVKAGSTSLSRVQQFVGMAKEPTSRASQEQINDDLVSLVAAVSRRIRLLLVIEDIDRTSRRLSSLVEGLVRRAEDSRLWIAITTRTGDAFTGIAASLRLTLGDTVREVALSPLTAADSGVLSSFLALDSDHRDRAEQRAGGNPWFLEEFCRSSSPAALPKPVRLTLSSVIATLPADACQAAEILSLFDEPATLDVIVEISGVPQAELKKTILDLERNGLVDGETLTIRYPDARVLIHSKIPKARRTDLHARCLTSLQAAGYKDSVLADHAFQGEMLELAADLYRELGKACFTRGDYLKAGRYFDLLGLCCARDRTARPLDCEDSIKLARCCGAQGNNGRAKEILRRLLNAKSWGDSEVLSSIYSTMASVAIAGSPEERVRLLKLAIAALSRDSTNLAHRHAALAGALISVGNLSEAQEVLKGIESYGLSETDVKPLVGIWGSLLLNQGNFRDAARCYSDALAISTSPGAIQTNLAVCLEQLGDIRGARERQTEALDHARQGGPLIFQVLCLGNLGAMETKLGNIRAAENRFHEARMTLRLASRQSANSEAIKVLSTTADMAELAIQKGEYRSARAFLEALDFRRSKTFSAFSAMDRFLVAMTRCQLHLALGQSQVVESLLKEARSLPVSGAYFQVERLLIEQCLEESSNELCGRLHQGLAMCEQLGTVYQGCRVRIALGRHLVALGDHE